MTAPDRLSEIRALREAITQAPIAFAVRWNRQPRYDEFQFFEKEKEAAALKKELVENGWTDVELIPLCPQTAAAPAAVDWLVREVEERDREIAGARQSGMEYAASLIERNMDRVIGKSKEVDEIRAMLAITAAEIRKHAALQKLGDNGEDLSR